jgi:thiol:disulfide interchange protein
VKAKTVVSLLLVAFVAVSLALAFQKSAPTSFADQKEPSPSDGTEGSVTTAKLDAKLAEAHFTAVYFHAPHQCATCRKIESFSHAALIPEIKGGNLAWQKADYTTDTNAALVDQFKVVGPTVVLVEVRGGNIVRWKNLEEVWDHTGDQADFTAFIVRAWSQFKAS